MSQLKSGQPGNSQLKCAFLLWSVMLYSASATALEEVRVYRCEHENRVVEFSDRYCGKGAMLSMMQVQTASGLQLGSAGDFGAVERGNRDRAARRGISRGRRLLSKLSTDYDSNRQDLETKFQTLPDNALKKANERDINLELQELKRTYLDEKDALNRQLQKVVRKGLSRSNPSVQSKR